MTAPLLSVSHDLAIRQLVVALAATQIANDPDAADVMRACVRALKAEVIEDPTGQVVATFAAAIPLANELIDHAEGVAAAIRERPAPLPG